MSPTLATADNAAAQMRKGILEFCVLLVIARGHVYASDILEELKKSDLLVVEGTLYPLLSRLRTANLVDYTWEESPSGPPRKYYTLTREGITNLNNLTEHWKRLTSATQSLIKKYEKNN